MTPTKTSPPGRLVLKPLGFSLLELVVVLVIMGLAAAVVIPSFISGWSGLQLETAARDLVTEMKVARTQAISRQKVFRFRLSQDLDSTKSVAAALANEFGEPIKVFPIDSSIRLVTDQDSLLLEISFYPNGRSSGASFQLRNQAGKTIALEVDAITGFARVSKPKTES